MTGVEELAAAEAFLLIGEEAIVLAEEEAGLFYAFGEEIAEIANGIIAEFQLIAEEGEAAVERIITQFAGM